MIAGIINKNNRYATSEVEDYVGRVVANMTDDELAVMETSISTYAEKIKDKLKELEKVYRHQLFNKWIDSGKIICDSSYAFEPVITPANTIDSIPYSLYDAEKNDMNSFERNVLDIIVGTNNIRWWHRNIENKGFRLNGFINHYPDFIVMTKSNRIILVETKGDFLDGEDSRAKLELGRRWQEQAGRFYRYFMVFKDKDLGLNGAYTLDQFAEIMKEL